MPVVGIEARRALRQAGSVVAAIRRHGHVFAMGV